MASTYIDVNAANSSMLDSDNNNRWVYRINEGLELPTGTEIKVASSFINKKGITGGSIEIPADIEETLNYSFYGVDTDYNTLIQHPQDPATALEFDLYERVNTPVNSLFAGREFVSYDVNPLSNGTSNFDKYMPQREKVGGSETKMPYMNFYKKADGTLQITPMVGTLTIKIPKGVYSVLQLAILIQDQFNGIVDPDDIKGRDTFVQRQKALTVPGWQGIPVTNIMNRLVQAEEGYLQPDPNAYTGAGNPKFPTGNTQTIPFWTALFTHNDVVPGPPVGINPDSTKFSDQLKLKGGVDTAGMLACVAALDSGEHIPYSAIMVQSDHFEFIRRASIETDQANFDTGTLNVSEDMLQFNKFGQTNSTNKFFFQGLNAQRNTNAFQISSVTHYNTPATGMTERGKVPTDPEFQKLGATGFSTESMNYFTTGIPVGTTQVELSYDTQNAGFSISRLHQPRKFPTHDRFGTSQSSQAGQEGVFIKRVAKGNFQNPTLIADAYLAPNGAAIAATATAARALLESGGINAQGRGEDYTILTNTIEAIMSRLGGVAVYNWAVKTAEKFGTKKFNNKGSAHLRRFDEYFNSEVEAKRAWESTLWFRLGFSYDQLQKPSGWGTEPTYYSRSGSHQSPGFTTDQSIDSSVITSISTLFNSFNAAAPTTAPPAQGTPTPILKDVGIQVYSMLDVNVPSIPFNNNSHVGGDTAFPTNFAAYQNSFYDCAVMTPVTTDARPIVAEALPTLSEHGYYLISSSIVGDQDIVKAADPLPILDVVPISSLSNQDFIADRTEITHILSNPKTLNHVDIAILNPDLTAPKLEKNSAVILKITKPLEKPTNLIANVVNNQTAELVEQQVLQMEKAEEAQAKQAS